MQNKLTHHHLTAEAVNDEHGKAIMLTQQDGLEEPNTVLVHPWQLRAVCEQFDLIASDPQVEKTIATLKRRMEMLRDCIAHLHDYLANHSDHRHADLSYEVAYATACIDLADEFCADFDVTHLRTTTSAAAQRQPDQAAVIDHNEQASFI